MKNAEIARWDHYVEFLRSQTTKPRRRASGRGRERPVVTISRQSGTGAHAVAEELIALIEGRGHGEPWTVVDRTLVDRVLEDHRLPRDMARFMPEDRITEISDTLDTLFGLHPPAWTLVRKTADTILRLAHLGNVVIIGRAANIITADLPHAFHVRLIGSPAARIERFSKHHGVERREAAERVRIEDRGRKRYVKKYYGEDIDDPLLYDLVVNTDRVSYRDAARLIAAYLGTVPLETVEPQPTLLGARV